MRIFGGGALRRLQLRDPFLQFLTLGLVIFLLAEWRAQSQQEARALITVDESLQTYLENLYSVQFGVYPDAATLDQLIENHVREEVLFREALRLGLAQQDEIIRRRLVQKMEYLLMDAEGATDHDEAELRAYYEQHPDQYRQPARVTFRHVYFSEDGRPAGTAEAAAESVLRLARQRQATIVPEDGDHFPLNDAYSGLSEREARQLFGQSPMISALFEADTESWSGPYRSGYGLHLIFVEQRTDATVADFSEVRDRVEAAWLEADRQARFEENLQAMFDGYTVERTVSVTSASDPEAVEMQLERVQ